MKTNLLQKYITLVGGPLLALLSQWSQADAPAQVPLYLSISPSKPNVMLLIDSSGSMDMHDVITGAVNIDAMPTDTTYTCNTPISNINPATGAYITIKMKISDSNPPPIGTVLVCTSISGCRSYTEFSPDYCFDINKSYKVKYFDGTSFGTDTTYNGLNLDWYFTNGTFTHATKLVAQGENLGTRMKVAKEAAKNFVYSLVPEVDTQPTVRLALSIYDASAGGKLLVPMTDVDHATVDTVNTQIDGINAGDVTPLAEALADVGRYFATGYSGSLILHPGTLNESASISTVFLRPLGGSTGKPAPIESYCQKNFAIVISDGLPNEDRDISPKLTDYSGDCGVKGLCDATKNTLNLPGPNVNLMEGSAGCPSSSGDYYHLSCQNGTKKERKYEKGGSDFLDDVALALYEMDLRPDLSKPGSFKSNVTTYTIGLADPNLYPPNVLSEAARLGGGKFFFAEDAAKLASSLEEIIKEIGGQSGTSAAMSASTSTTTTETTIFQAKFDSSYWTGDLLAYPVINHLTGEVASDPVWNAAHFIHPWGDNTAEASPLRTILTYAPPSGSTSGEGKLFQCNQLTSDQQVFLGISNCTNANDKGVWRLNYFRGDWHHEELNPKRLGGDDIRSTTTPAERVFRNRNNLYKEYDDEAKVDQLLVNTTRFPDPWLLGDIVNSNPVFVGQANYGYEVLPDDEGSSYLEFRAATSYTQRRPMVYVGANDGMLHGFDATNPIATPYSMAPGREMVAYVPNAIYPRLINLSSPQYKSNHLYFVDGSPQASDAYFKNATTSNKWRTVLVGTTGAGGKAIFALDVTNPGEIRNATSTFTSSNVLWEVSDTNAATTASTDLTSDTTTVRGFANNLGYTMSQPSIVRMKDGSWAAIVANGYYSVGNRAVLYILDIQDGHIIKTIEAINSDESGFTDTKENFRNGLSTPYPVDLNSDTIADYIYAGDLRGNLWKFDVNSDTPNDWKVANSGKPLYVACDDPSKTRSNCPQENRQPITAAPVIGVGKVANTYMVYFGTGKYFEFSDNNLASAHTQTFYGIIDRNNDNVVPILSTATVRSTLAMQTIEEQDGTWRITSSNACGYDGWYIDLTDIGERVVSFPQLRGQRVIFVTLIPSPPDSSETDPCGTSSGGTGWLMELSAMCGTRLPSSPWDVNDDGKIDGSDLVSIDGSIQPPSGKKSDDGIPLPPPIVNLSKTIECKYILVKGKPQCLPETRDSTGDGRQSWRQIR